MSTPNTGTNQHIIPQHMIRCFAGPDGRLAHLHKPSLKLGTKRRSPKSILCTPGYFDDRFGTIDGEWTSIENAYARARASIENFDSIPGDLYPVISMWAASLAARGPLLAAVYTALDTSEGRSAETHASAINTSRMFLRAYLHQLFRHDRWTWMKLGFEEGPIGLVLADNPVILPPPTDPMPMIMVPLSSQFMVMGGESGFMRSMSHEQLSPYRINLAAFAYAERSVFAATKESLKQLQQDLSAESPLPETMKAASLKPHCGVAEYIAEQVRSKGRRFQFPEEYVVHPIGEYFGIGPASRHEVRTRLFQTLETQLGNQIPLVIRQFMEYDAQRFRPKSAARVRAEREPDFREKQWDKTRKQRDRKRRKR